MKLNRVTKKRDRVGLSACECCFLIVGGMNSSVLALSHVVQDTTVVGGNAQNEKHMRILEHSFAEPVYLFKTPEGRQITQSHIAKK